MSTTYAAIWRNSLSQFSVRASQNDPLVAYSPKRHLGLTVCPLVVVVVGKPVNSNPTMKNHGQPEAHQRQAVRPEESGPAGLRRLLAADRRCVLTMTGSYPHRRTATRTERSTCASLAFSR